MGIWYVQATTPNFFQPPGTTCDISYYTDKGDGTFQVCRKYLKRQKADGNKSSLGLYFLVPSVRQRICVHASKNRSDCT